MHSGFATTENTRRFLAGLNKVKDRGAKEANLMVVTGEPGFGKTSTVEWWCAQFGGVILRANANWTYHWMLTDLVKSFKGVAPKRISEDLFRQAIQALMSKKDGIIGGLVIDEAEHALRSTRLIEGIRDLSDRVYFPVILVGMGDITGEIARFPQISSRIASVVQFEAGTLEDVRLCCEALSEVPIHADVVERIFKETKGRTRLVLNNIALVERIGKQSGRMVTMDDCRHVEWIHEWTARHGRPSARVKE